jgi:hypothetical protein
MHMTCHSAAISRPRKIHCSDGMVRNVVFPLCFHAGDWPEQCDICGLMKSTQAAKPCNMCHIGLNQLFTSNLAPSRSAEELEATREAAELAYERGGMGACKAADEIYKEASMRHCYVNVCYLALHNSSVTLRSVM